MGRMQPGGAEIRLVELLGRLRPDEFQVDVAVLSGLAGSLDEQVRHYGGDVVPVRLDARFPARFIRLLRGRRYHVVHSHVLYTSGPILALAAAAGVPVRVAHFHATHDGRETSWRRELQRRAMRGLIERYATDIIACGEGSMDAVWHPTRSTRRGSKRPSIAASFERSSAFRLRPRCCCISGIRSRKRTTAGC
jgi:hypothetical protein